MIVVRGGGPSGVLSALLCVVTVPFGLLCAVASPSELIGADESFFVINLVAIAV